MQINTTIAALGLRDKVGSGYKLGEATLKWFRPSSQSLHATAMAQLTDADWPGRRDIYHQCLFPLDHTTTRNLEDYYYDEDDHWEANDYLYSLSPCPESKQAADNDFAFHRHQDENEDDRESNRLKIGRAHV